MGRWNGKADALTDKVQDSFAANDVRLSPREWAVAAAIVVAVLLAAPAIGDRADPLVLQADDRTPFALGEDYRTYARRCRTVCADVRRAVIVGDSVVWGHYVGPDQTLSAHLNRQDPGRRFSNLGIDGIHPAALAGLMEHYGQAISCRWVVLHCNLLWMSSPRRDLRTTKEFSFNHPDLVPQFSERIPCYRATTSRRLGVVIGRTLPFFGWARHVQLALWDGKDLASWTIEHPYENPLAALWRRPPSPHDPPSPKPLARPWTERDDVLPLSPPWVELDESYQWRSFRRTVAVLTERRNRVFVLVGPFNEHMLTPEAREVYADRKARVRAWLAENKIPHWVPGPLPSEVYADASHPLGEGYRLLAEGLLGEMAFCEAMSIPETTK